ncbi:hypothetical protein HOY80DRAFT_1021474 [Tuber brumale]|nr:hypothetical protein HOY80DRAFT_1021474 [Tuber brumale]
MGGQRGWFKSGNRGNGFRLSLFACFQSLRKSRHGLGLGNAKIFGDFLGTANTSTIPLLLAWAQVLAIERHLMFVNTTTVLFQGVQKLRKDSARPSRDWGGVTLPGKDIRRYGGTADHQSTSTNFNTNFPKLYDSIEYNKKSTRDGKQKGGLNENNTERNPTIHLPSQSLLSGSTDRGIGEVVAALAWEIVTTNMSQYGNEGVWGPGMGDG